MASARGDGGEAEPLIRIDVVDAVRGAIRREDIELLTDAGLPRSAAPWLAFDGKPGMLAAAREAAVAPPETASLVELGANGSGDPVCLDPETGRAVYLNHDDGFRAVLVNSSALAPGSMWPDELGIG